MTQPWDDGRIHGYYNLRGDLVLVDEGESAPPGPGWTEVSWPAEATPGVEFATFFHSVSADSTQLPDGLWNYDVSSIPAPEGWKVVSCGFLAEAAQVVRIEAFAWENGNEIRFIAQAKNQSSIQLVGILMRGFGDTSTQFVRQGQEWIQQ